MKALSRASDGLSRGADSYRRVTKVHRCSTEALSHGAKRMADATKGYVAAPIP